MNTKRLISFAISFSIASILSTIVYIYYVLEKDQLQDDIRLVSQRVENLVEAEIISLRRVATIEKELYQFLYLSPNIRIPLTMIDSHIRELSFLDNNIGSGLIKDVTLADAESGLIKKIAEKDELLRLYDNLKDNNWIKALLITMNEIKTDKSEKVNLPEYDISHVIDSVILLRQVHNQLQKTFNAYRVHFSETNSWNIEELNQLEKNILNLIVLIFITQIGIYFLSNRFEFWNLKLESYDLNFNKRRIYLMTAVFSSGLAFLVDQITLHSENLRSNYSSEYEIERSVNESITNIHRETRAISLLLNELSSLDNIFRDKSPYYEGNDDDIQDRKYSAKVYQGIAALNSFSNWAVFLDRHKDDVFTIRDNLSELNQEKLMETFTKDILSGEALNGNNQYKSIDLLTSMASSLISNFSDSENPRQAPIDTYSKSGKLFYYLIRFYENTISQNLQRESHKKLNFLREEINWFSVLIGILIAVGTALQVIALLSMFEFLRLSFICRSNEKINGQN